MKAKRVNKLVKMFPRKTGLQIMCVAVFVSLLPALRATTLARLSLDQLAAHADSVAGVRCANVQSRRENGTIWTVTTFDVTESMKGSLPARVTVRIPGGKIGHFTETVDGTPQFAPGEQAVVFLEKSRDGGFSVAGWVQGTFRIAQDPASRGETVTQDSSAFAVFDGASRTFRAEGIRRMPMELFRAKLRAAVTRAQEKSR